MNLPQRARFSHDVPVWVEPNSFFFITLNCEPRGSNALCQSRNGEAVLAAAKHTHEKGAWNCRMMLLMPDHLHAVIAFPREPPLKTIVSNWKRFLATKTGIHWQRDSFDH